MFKTAFGKAAVVTALIGGMGAAAASPTLTNSAGSFANFGGFDWASNGTAVVDGFNPFVTNSTFNLTYWASADTVRKIGGAKDFLASAGLGINYEYTIQVVLTETSTCTAFVLGQCTTATFNVNSGSFRIWYDTTPDQNQVTGAGTTDGLLLLAGTVSAQDGGGFNVITGGNATLQGDVNFTNSSFITPDLTGSTATSTLQIGANQTSWTAPTSLPGVAGGTIALPANALLFQADANQSFVASVPEPGTLAMVGLALTGLGFGAARRRKV